MSAVIIQISPKGEEALRALEGFPEAAKQAIARGLDKGAALVLGKVTRERFTGKGPFPVGEHRLGVRTNRYRSSLRWSKATVSGDVVGGSIGSNVRYAGAHEYGYQGTVQVRSFSRQVSPTQFTKAGTGIKVGSRDKSGRFIKKAALGTETVRAHSRVMNTPARAPLGTGIEEHKQTFGDQITAQLLALWGSKGGA